MIQEENLDIRTITMGISLLDCCDADIDRSCEKIYEKIMNVFKRFDGITDIKDLMIHDYGYNNLIITAKIIA